MNEERSNSLTALRKVITARFSDGQIRDIEVIVENNKDKYENVSHFVRCAVLRLVRQEK